MTLRRCRPPAVVVPTVAAVVVPTVAAVVAAVAAASVAVLATGPARATGLEVRAPAIGSQQLLSVVPEGPVVSVAAGDRHTCAVAPDRTGRCWGTGSQLRLGTGSTATALRPATVRNPFGTPLLRLNVIAAGAQHSCAGLTDGTVWCWGATANGRLGIGPWGPSTAPPTRVVEVGVGVLTGARSVAAGTAHGCAVLAGGGVRCWGAAAQVGAGGGGDRWVAVPVLDATTGAPLDGAREVVAGPSHTCARRGDSTVRCWGTGAGGRLGDGSTADAPAAVAVVDGAGGLLGGVSSVAAGADHTCAALGDGTVRCWGAAGDGRLGNGSTAPDSPVPVTVVTAGGAPLDGVTAVAAGAGFGCARRTDTTVWCWGSGANGRLGNGSTASSTVAVAVLASSGAPLTGVDRLTAGTAHACGSAADGRVWCWGAGTGGQLGTGTAADSTRALAVTLG